MATIREGTEFDLPRLISLVAEMAEQPVYRGLAFDAMTAAETLAALLTRPEGLVLVTVVDDEVQGFLLAQITDSWWGPWRTASNYYVFMSRSARGHGHGYTMLREFVRWAERQGADRVTTTNDSDMPDERWCRAIQRLGFDRAGSVGYRRSTHGG
jgi:GNAT superfamily N-acetyltransferase